MQILQEMKQAGLLPVVKIHDKEEALLLAQVMQASHLSIVIIPFHENISAILDVLYKHDASLVVGISDISANAQIVLAKQGGASFIISDGFYQDMVALCQEHDMLYIPTCFGAVDLLQAQACDVQVTLCDEPSYKKDHMQLIHATEETAYTALYYEQASACICDWLISMNLMKQEGILSVTKHVENKIAALLKIKIAHVGMNCSDDTQAKDVAAVLKRFLFTDRDERPISYFIGDVEVMKMPYLGSKGHIGFHCDYVYRAVYYLEKRGFHFLPDTAQYDIQQQVSFIYAKEEIHGFAVHFVKRPK